MTSVSGGWFVGPSSCSLRRSRLVTSGLRALLSHCAQPPAGSSNELEASPPPTPTEADEELGMTDGVTVKLYRYQPEQPQVHVRACPPATPACTHACLPACVPGCLPSDAACGLLPRPLPHPQTLGFSHLLSPEQLSFLMSEARVRASSCLRARDRREQRGRHSSSTRSSPCNEPPTTTRPPPVRSRAGGGPGAGGGGPGGAGDCVEQRGVPAALRSHAALAAGHRPVRQPAAAGGWFEGLPKGGEQSRCVCILPAVDTPTTHPPTHPPTLLTGLPRAPLLRGLRAEPSRDLGGSEVGGCAGARAAAGGNHFLSSFLCTDYYKLYITRASTCAGGLRCETLPGPLPRGPPPPHSHTQQPPVRHPPLCSQLPASLTCLDLCGVCQEDVEVTDRESWPSFRPAFTPGHSVSHLTQLQTLSLRHFRRAWASLRASPGAALARPAAARHCRTYVLITAAAAAAAAAPDRRASACVLAVPDPVPPVALPMQGRVLGPSRRRAAAGKRGGLDPGGAPWGRQGQPWETVFGGAGAGVRQSTH